MIAIYRIIRYLIGTPDMGHFCPTNMCLKLIGYSDANWAGCIDINCLIMGWCMFLGIALFYSEIRSMNAFLNLLLNLSIRLCHLLALRLSDFEVV